MISVEQALAIVRNQAVLLGTETIPLDQSLLRILREPLVADRDFPPFDRVTMDGIAIRYGAFAEGKRLFRIEGIAPAGASQATLRDPGACLEVMTGAMLPNGADTVIRYEDLEISDNQAALAADLNVQAGQNIHRRGADRRQGTVIVPAGSPIGPSVIGVAATVGKTFLQVAKLPEIVVLSSGDELVSVGETPLPHQIRRSNSHSIQAILRTWALDTVSDHLPDDPAVIREKLGFYLETNQALIMSGGVSEGKYDFIPSVLAELGVERLFHKVKQRPGKPLWFGRKPGGAVVFAMPGNPVSTFLSTHLYFRAWLDACLGLNEAPRYAILEKDFRFVPDLSYFLLVKSRILPDGRVLADPHPGGGSGDLAGLTDADGFLILPAEETDFKAGTPLRWVPFQ